LTTIGDRVEGEEMAIYVDKNNKVVIEFEGDIFTGINIQDEYGVMIFSQGKKGEIGRDVHEIDTSPDNPGVIFAAKDRRSLDVIITVLEELRDKMEESER
jgi:hypothetical protein